MKKILKLLFITLSSLFIFSCGKTEKKEVLEINKVAVLDLAALDIIDSLDLGDKVVAIPKKTKIDYLSKYYENEKIEDLGSLKEINMEKLAKVKPDLIIVGGRQKNNIEKLEKIAKVLYISTDYKKGTLESLKENIAKISEIFKLNNEKSESLIKGYSERLENIKSRVSSKSALMLLVSSSNVSTMGDNARLSLISKEAGFKNLASEINSTHGNEVSFEYILEKNPDYIFVLDRDVAINTKGSKLAKEVMDNDIINKTNASINGNIVYLTPYVWYLAEGGAKAMDIMIEDIENAIK